MTDLRFNHFMIRIFEALLKTWIVLRRNPGGEIHWGIFLCKILRDRLARIYDWKILAVTLL